MDNHDQLFNKIKDASHKQEAKDFAAIDKVWSRVEDKLDNKVLQKENHLWKKIAVAASFLLLFTIGYQFLQPKKQIEIPKNSITIKDSIRKEILPIPETQKITVAEKTNPAIKKEAAEILEKQLNQNTETAVSISLSMKETSPAAPVVANAESFPKAVVANDQAEDNAELFKRKKSTAVGVRNEQEVSGAAAKIADAAQMKSDPLVVIDGNPVTSKNGRNDQSVKDGLSKLKSDDIEDIVILKEPLYIINGHYYSEEELFGPNPTSPYAPLNKQEIESLSILQGEKAIEAYGKKGSKGVVIISTKNQKPVNQAAEKGK